MGRWDSAEERGPDRGGGRGHGSWHSVGTSRVSDPDTPHAPPSPLSQIRVGLSSFWFSEQSHRQELRCWWFLWGVISETGLGQGGVEKGAEYRMHSQDRRCPACQLPGPWLSLPLPAHLPSHPLLRVHCVVPPPSPQKLKRPPARCVIILPSSCVYYIKTHCFAVRS